MEGSGVHPRPRTSSRIADRPHRPGRREGVVMNITRKGFLRAVAGGSVASGLGALTPVSLFAAAQAEKKRRPMITSVEATPFSVPLKGVAKISIGVPINA